MGGVARFPASNALATYANAPDSVYGTADDGDATLDGTTTV